MFSGDCYHTEIKIYLKQRKIAVESITKFYNKAVHVLKPCVPIIHGTHTKHTKTQK